MPLPAVIRLIAPGSITACDADAVAMLDRAVEQIGDGGEVDVRMRPDVHALARRQPRRAEFVDEDERPDHRPLAAGSVRLTLKSPRSCVTGVIIWTKPLSIVAIMILPERWRGSTRRGPARRIRSPSAA